MSIDHATFAELLADLDDLDELPDNLDEHANHCERCAQRLDMARRIHTTAQPSLTDTVNTVEVDQMTDAVLAVTHPPARSRTALIAAAAAAVAVVIAGGVGILANNTSSDSSDVLADIADQYRDGDGTRFVYATNATVDVTAEYDLDDNPSGQIESLSTRIPTCPDDTTSTDAGGDSGASSGLDLAPIVEALQSDDPCVALALIDESVGQSAVDTYTALSASINRTAGQIDAISRTEAGTPLAAASGAVYRDQRQQDLDAATTALDNLTRSFTSLTTTLEPLTEAGPVQLGTRADVADGVVALKAQTAAAQEALIDIDPTVNWTQVATGTWSPTGIDISGTTERNGTDSQFTGVQSDPLGLASVMLSNPARLTSILDSAPSSTADTIQWALPDDLVPGPRRWTASARHTNGQLDEFTLQSGDVTVTFTPAR